MNNIIMKTAAWGACLAGCWTVAAATTPTAQEAAINGVWTLAQPAGGALKTAEGAAPPLNADGKTQYEQNKAGLAKKDATVDLSQKCKPIGFPRVLWDGGNFDMQVQPNIVFQGYTWNRNHRSLPYGPKLPRLQVPRYYGTSAARWDGDTLVIESGMFSGNTLLDSTGLPHSEDMLLTERYKPLDGGKKLEVSLNVTDDIYYSKPWTVKLTFNRVPDGRILEDVCEARAPFFKDLMKGR
ncbi:MAG: hypothetical protein QM718_07365 [Steroidobacteraceae bacterium]